MAAMLPRHHRSSVEIHDRPKKKFPDSANLPGRGRILIETGADRQVLYDLPVLDHALTESVRPTSGW